MEDEESLEPGALVSKLPDPVQNQVNNLLADGVVTPGVVVGGVLFACDQLLGVEQLPVGPGADLTRVFMNISSTALMNVFCTLSSTRFEYLLCNFRQKRY